MATFLVARADGQMPLRLAVAREGVVVDPIERKMTEEAPDGSVENFAMSLNDAGYVRMSDFRRAVGTDPDLSPL